MCFEICPNYAKILQPQKNFYARSKVLKTIRSGFENQTSIWRIIGRDSVVGSALPPALCPQKSPWLRQQHALAPHRPSLLIVPAYVLLILSFSHYFCVPVQLLSLSPDAGEAEMPVRGGRPDALGQEGCGGAKGSHLGLGTGPAWAWAVSCWLQWDVSALQSSAGARRSLA